MSLERITQGVEGRLLDLTGLKYKVKFDLGDDGIVFVDGRANPPTLSNEDGEADCTIRLSPDSMEKLIAGTLNPTLAYSMGKLKVDGSMGVALKVASMLED